MSKAGKREEWVGRLASYEGGGLSQRQWCEENGVPLHQFAYWRGRLKQQAEGQVTPAGWCAVAIQGKSSDGRVDSRGIAHQSGLTVLVGSAAIHVERGFDAGLLREVVRALVPETGLAGAGLAGERAC